MSSKMHGKQFLKGLSQYRVAPGVETLVIRDYLSALDCPRSLAIWLLFSNNEHQQLTEIEFDPHAYENYVECRDAYAATKFLSKYKGLSLPFDLDEVAMRKFFEFELLCKQTNARFRSLSSCPLYRGATVWLHSATIRKIDKVLGEFSVEEFFSKPDWGPGASTLIKRSDASPVEKFQCEIGITRDLLDLLPLNAFKEIYPLWAQALCDAGFPGVQVGNKVVTVPKDASTNRVIAIEPGINLWFQKSIGDMIGSRLRRFGIDIRYQTRNQQLAKKASFTGHLVTVDMSSASDSICSSVVEALLPLRWHFMMDRCRSRYGSSESGLVEWSKFSSMGNGFTFPLQTLIFYAVACSCVNYLHLSSDEVSVYGDDIILPTAAFSLFSEMMNFYGFRINLKKSHYDSYFRESCGSHYYRGLDLKPIYLKDKLTSVQSMFRLANAIRRLAHRRNFGYGCDARFRTTFDLLVRTVPSSLRIRIPEGLGDGGFISNFDEATPKKARHGIEGYFVYNLTEVSFTNQDERVGYLLSQLWRMSRSPEKELLSGNRTKLKATDAPITVAPGLEYNTVPSHKGVRLKIVRSLVQQWYDLGPWL